MDKKKLTRADVWEKITAYAKEKKLEHDVVAAMRAYFNRADVPNTERQLFRQKMFVYDFAANYWCKWLDLYGDTPTSIKDHNPNADWYAKVETFFAYIKKDLPNLTEQARAQIKAYDAELERREKNPYISKNKKDQATHIRSHLKEILEIADQHIDQQSQQTKQSDSHINNPYLRDDGKKFEVRALAIYCVLINYRFNGGVNAAKRFLEDYGLKDGNNFLTHFKQSQTEDGRTRKRSDKRRQKEGLDTYKQVLKLCRLNKHSEAAKTAEKEINLIQDRLNKLK